MQKILFIILCFPFLAVGQVEHNFEVAPSKTDCHKLPSGFASLEKAFETIEGSTFLLEESIKISRYHSPRAARFYSCDGHLGFLIVDVNDAKSIIYEAVSQGVWSQFINSADPIGFYEAEIKTKQKLLTASAAKE